MKRDEFEKIRKMICLLHSTTNKEPDGKIFTKIRREEVLEVLNIFVEINKEENEN